MSRDGLGKRARSATLVLLKLAVSIGLLVILLGRADLAHIADALGHADPWWIVAGLAIYAAILALSAWRWDMLLAAQDVRVPFPRLIESFLVATFFNNFLPSNVGGDVIRIADTAGPAGSRTLATTVVLLDRAMGLLGLVLIAAVGASVAAATAHDVPGPVGASTLWIGLIAATVVATPVFLAPEVLHIVIGPIRRLHPEWIDERMERLTGALERFRERPIAMVGCFAGAVLVQGALVIFYYTLARSLDIPIGLMPLALLVPISFVVQMLPVSINGFGVREAIFGLYFARLGLPLSSAILLSLVGAAAIMLVSVAGALAYIGRLRRARFAATRA
jgi:uncharacterized protein (TIRG00374 family)